MISLRDDQQDALIEICNIGMSKAAKQLSILLNNHINILIPKISLLDVKTFLEERANSSEEIFSYVNQVISHGLQGEALLIFHREHASMLTQSVIGKMPNLSAKEVRAYEQEAVLEIGNIMITSCMSAIVNMLSLKIKLDVPHYGEGNINTVMDSQMKEIKHFAEDVILIATHLESSGKDISGSLLLMLSKDSIFQLLDGIDRLLKQ